MPPSRPSSPASAASPSSSSLRARLRPDRSTSPGPVAVTAPAAAFCASANVRRTDPCADLADARRAHAQLVHSEAQQQGRDQRIGRRLSAHLHRDARSRAGLCDSCDEPEHRRVVGRRRCRTRNDRFRPRHGSGRWSRCSGSRTPRRSRRPGPPHPDPRSSRRARGAPAASLEPPPHPPRRAPGVGGSAGACPVPPRARPRAERPGRRGFRASRAIPRCLDPARKGGVLSPPKSSTRTVAVRPRRGASRGSQRSQVIGPRRPAGRVEKGELGADQAAPVGAGAQTLGHLGGGGGVHQDGHAPAIRGLCGQLAQFRGPLPGASLATGGGACALHHLRRGVGYDDALAAVHHEQRPLGFLEQHVAHVGDQRDAQRPSHDGRVRGHTTASKRDPLDPVLDLDHVGRAELGGRPRSCRHPQDGARMDHRHPPAGRRAGPGCARRPHVPRAEDPRWRRACPPPAPPPGPAPRRRVCRGCRSASCRPRSNAGSFAISTPVSTISASCSRPPSRSRAAIAPSSAAEPRSAWRARSSSAWRSAGGTGSGSPSATGSSRRR